MSIDSLIVAHKDGRLDIECAEMSLRQRTGTNPISFRGTGRIRQSSEGVLEFELRANEYKNTDMVSYFNEFMSVKPGTLIDEKRYYDLHVRGADGLGWVAERIRINPNWPGSDGSPTITGQLSVLTTSQAGTGPGHWLQIHFFEDVEVPTIMGSYKFSAIDSDFTVQKHDHEFVVEVHSPTPLGENLYLRIQEALMFLLAQSVKWRAIVTHDGSRQRLELGSAVPRSLHTRIDPPIARPHHAHLLDLWNMFSRYLEYVVKTTPHPHWSRCSYDLLNAREASTNSIDAWSIGLGVAVEGIASNIRVEKTRAEKKLLANLQKSILKHVASEPRFAPFTKRLTGLLGMMSQDRLHDRLRPLIDSGHVDPAHLKAWGDLRHKHVHPNVSDLRDVASADYQALFDLMSKTTVLMYHVVFYLIGYQGKYTDYGTYGYPLRDYPLAPPKISVAPKVSGFRRALRKAIAFLLRMIGRLGPIKSDGIPGDASSQAGVTSLSWRLEPAGEAATPLSDDDPARR